MRLLGLRIGVLGRFYRWRLREHGVQELLAAAGIAVGVALVFGVLVANTSLPAAAEQLVDGVVGSAQIQLAARSDDGFDQRIATAAGQLPGVERAAATLRANVSVIGPAGRRSIQLLGVTPALAQLGGVQTRDFGPGGLRLSNGVTLPSAVADAIGVRAGMHVRLLADGTAKRVRIGSVLGHGTIGSLAESPVGIALLPVAQRLVDRPGRVSHLLIEPEPGAGAAVARQLRMLSQGRLYVGPADAELRALALTAKPNDQSTTLFAAIGAMVGLLLALNAMLMTVPARRRFVAELRTQGFDRGQVLLILMFEALVLGSVASLAGLLLGELLSQTLFKQVPAYLAFAFPIGTQRTVESSTVLIALGGGMLAALLATLPLVMDLRRGRPLDAIFTEAGAAEGGERIGVRTAGGLLVAGVVIAAAATLLVQLDPLTTVAAEVMLAFATLCLIPYAFAAVIRPLAHVSRRARGSMLAVATMEIRATTMRSIALAAVGAIAVYGSVAIGGTRHDLVRGLDRNFAEYLSTADLWVTTGGDDLTTNSFDARMLPERLAADPDVSAIRSYQGGLLDVGDRRLWIIARDRADTLMIPPSQLVDGDLAAASDRIRRGGWAAVSSVFARSRELAVGDMFSLPTPSGPARFRVAAVTTNLGWPPGGVILNRTDYSRAWMTDDPTALQVDLAPGISPAAGKRSVERALGPGSGLRVQTQHERRAQYASLSRQGLTSLGQISVLLLVAAAVAIAAALGATIWQRRPRLAALKIQGFDQRQLWRALLIEGAIVLSIGCTLGAVTGLYGHALANRYLESTTGFPAPFSIAAGSLLRTFALVVGSSLAIFVLPGWAAAKVSPRVGFQE
ncbi:MAG: FtsX-like permease family protein [Conexibacter sp.]